MDIDEALESVKRFRGSFDAAARRPGSATDIQRHYAGLRTAADKLAAFLEDKRALFAPLAGDLGDVSDLPPELRKELTLTQPDELETQILSVVKALNGAADIDQILVGLYRKFKVVQKRRVVQYKIFRLQKKRALHAVSNKRGLYTLEPQATEERTVDHGEIMALIAPEDDDDLPF